MPNIQENYTDSQLDIISAGQVSAIFSNSQEEGGTDYIRLTLLDENGNYNRQFFSDVDIDVIDSDGNTVTVPEIGIYTNADGNIFVKPNEILDINGVPSGNYILQFDFLRDSDNSDNTLATGYFIKEISPSRKEVRLLQDDPAYIVNGTEFDNLGDFDYNWILGVSGGQNLSIVNYSIDDISNPGSPSWILRLNRPLPNNVVKLNKCFVAREVLSTQLQNIVYISSVAQVTVGGGLTVDTDFSYENTGVGGDVPQNKDELLVSASLSEDSLQEILSSINNKDKNLNIDFNDYENHIHFGSAVKKLENFKTKVVEINDYLGELSSSLTMTGNHSGSIANERKLLFEKVRDVQINFTPYERFLYFDGQSQTTASAPGIGTNYAQSYAMRQIIGTDSNSDNIESTKLSNYDGFNVVYNLNTENINDTKVQLFDDVYLAEQSPFFNYSGSVYLSFVMKSNETPTHINTNQNYGAIDDLGDGFNYNKVTIPDGTFSSEVIQGTVPEYAPSASYKRYIFVASQSYWRPDFQNGSGSYANIDNATYGFDRSADIASVSDFSSAGNGSPYWHADGTIVVNGGDYQILSGSSLNSDYLLDDIPIVLNDSSGKYGNLLSPSVIDEDGNIVTSQERSGSFVLPAGDLFALRFTASADYDSGTENTASFITDIKVTKNNPLNALPFTSIYHTGSNEWKDWYSGSYDSASAYDVDTNIHSFENNLPDYIKTSVDYGDLKIFLAMIGEHFDLIRNYIDNQKSFYSKSYKNYNQTGSKQLTVPDNVLPMIAENLGWEFINPYTGSLETYFNVVSDAGETLEEVKSETWRKVLNNLMYIYKTKGTINSINALLNTYGYPHEAMEISEIGGQSEHMNPRAISNKDTELFLQKGGLFRATGSIHAIKKNKLFYSLNMSERGTPVIPGYKKLHLDWWTNNANADTIEFVFKSSNPSSTTQSILESSGSGASTVWDLRLMPSASVSGTLTGSLQFRLNNSENANSTSIDSNAYSMSIDDLPLSTGKLWNVMLQRVEPTGSIAVSHSYKLYAGLQNGNRIEHFSVASMSIDGNSADGLGSASNANFIGTGSLTVAPESASSNVSGNLVVGRSLTGSIAEIRTWSGSLSSSKFKQHILNKFNVVGNTATASIDHIFYRFRLNENYSSASATDDVVDANPNSPVNTPTNYTRDLGFPSGSYSVDRITTIGLSPRLDSNIQSNTIKGLVNPDRSFKSRLSPIRRSTTTIYESQGINLKPKRTITTKVELTKNLNQKIDDYILENFSDVDLSDMIANPSDYYSSSYSELESFRVKAFKGIKVDANKFIENAANLFNDALIQNVKSILPAHSTLHNVGVSIKPTLLERNKNKHHRTDVFYGTGSGVGFYESSTFHFYYEKSGSVSGSYNRDLYIFNMSESKYISQYAMKEPFYMGNKDSGSGVYDWSGSKYFSTYNSIDPIHFGGGSGSYFHLTTGSSYFGQYNMKEPLYFKNKDSGSAIYDLSGSKYFSTYNSIDPIHFGGGSGSYFNLTTGSSYFAQYNMKEPLYFYYNNSGSSVFDTSGSKQFPLYNLIEPIYFGGGVSGSYFHSTTGSKYFPIYEEGTITSPSSSGATGSWADIEINNANREIANMGLLNGIRRSRDGSQFTTGSAPVGLKTHPSYIWDAWGTGSNDIWFMAGMRNSDGMIEQVNKGYYNKEFTFKVIGDIETLLHFEMETDSLISASVDNSEYTYDINYSNLHHFKNKIIVDEGEGFQYRGYIPTESSLAIDENKFIDGRPMGRTHYFVTSSDGSILYPPNHYTIAKTSKESLRNLLYLGANLIVGNSGYHVTGSRTSYYDPTGMDTSPDQAVTTISVKGSNTEAGLIVTSRGGNRNNNESGSIGKK